MSTAILHQSMTDSMIRGISPVSLNLSEPKVLRGKEHQRGDPISLPVSGLENLSLLIDAPEVHYRSEVPLADSPIVEDSKISARFVVDDSVYLDLNLVGQRIEQENKFEVGQFSIFYYIEERRPRAHFVADTLMAVIGLAGRLKLNIAVPKLSTILNLETSLLEISKMLHRRQTAYRLMLIEELTGKQFVLPSAISEREIERIAFVYHALVDRSIIWTGGSVKTSIPATQESASQIAQVEQPFTLPLTLESLNETVLGQPINLGRVEVSMENAVIKNVDEVREELGAGDGRQVTLEIHSRQDKYEFTEIPYSSDVLWEPKIQALINLEPYLNAAITERYHALAAATLEGLTEEEKAAVTTRPELDEDVFNIES